MHAHVDASPAKRDSFAFEPQPLLHSRMTAEFDLSPGADHSMPWNRPVRGPQRPGDLPRILRKSGGARHLAVCRHLAPRNFPDRREQIP